MDKIPSSSSVHNNSLDNAAQSAPANLKMNSITKKLQASNHLPTQAPIAKRTVANFLPTNFVNRLYQTLESTTAYQASKLYFSDLYATTVATFSGVYNHPNRTIAEALKFTSRLVGFNAALFQTAAAFITGTDFITPQLEKAGIGVTDMSRTDLVNLSASLAALQLGTNSELEINGGKFNINYPDYSITISDIKLANIREDQSAYSYTGDKDQLTLRADEMRFKLAIDNGEESPSVITISTEDIKLGGETNLLTLVSQAITNYCTTIAVNDAAMYLHKEGDRKTQDDDTKNSGGILWAEAEQSGVALDAKKLSMTVENRGPLLERIGFTEESIVALQDISLKQARTFIQPGQPGKPAVKLGLAELDQLQAGPVLLKSGFLRLNDDLNGELVFTLQTDYAKMQEFCPDWLPKCIRDAAIKPNEGEQTTSVRLGVKIIDGLVDLNSLAARGLEGSRLNQMQRLINRLLINTFNSEHTRLIKNSIGNELKVHVPLMSQTKPQAGNNDNQDADKSRQMPLTLMVKKIARKAGAIGFKTHQPLPEHKAIIPQQGGRGKISLVALFHEYADIAGVDKDLLDS